MQRTARPATIRTLALAVISTMLVMFAVPIPATAADVDVDTRAVVINEVAAGSSQSDSDSFFELRNTSDHPVDLTDWKVFRCSMQGLRAGIGRLEADLRGVVLQPGEIFTAGRVGMILHDGTAPDALFTQPYSSQGFGLVLLDAQGRLRDAVGVYPNQPWPTQSECTRGRNLTNALAFALDESWQRVAATGNTALDWVRATATAGEPNATEDAPADTSGIRIDEVASGGPAGWGDDLVELFNAGQVDVDLGGWRLYRCTALGVASPQTVQVSFETGRMLAAGARLVIGGPGYTAAPDERSPDATMSTSLAGTVSGVLLVTDRGERVDGVTVSNHPDTACQTGDEKLPSVLDYRTGQSWQRDAVTGEFGVAARTPADAAPASASGSRTALDALARGMAAAGGVAISEFATDPHIDAEPAGYVQNNYVELGNYGDSTLDISGWRVIACGVDGFRSTDTLVTVAPGTRVRPGQTWLAALEGTPVALYADTTFEAPFDFLGAGVWIEDRRGERVDSLGVYHANEMDFSIERYSPCTNGSSPPTFAVDRLRHETFQRTGFTGTDADDFVAATSTPGDIDRHEASAVSDLTAAAEARLRESTVGQNTLARMATVAESGSSASAEASQPARMIEAFTGASEGGALVPRAGVGEQRATDAAALRARDDGYLFPYVRMRLTPGVGESVVTWQGGGIGRNELSMSVWSPATSSWRLLDADAASTADAVVTLSGVARADEVIDGALEVLVQSAPRVDAPFAENNGEGFAEPADYDFAISHITDTQYLSEAYPDVYAELLGWIVANRESRKIAFATHTGDLIQNWVDPDQAEDRARREYQTASEIQQLLDDAGVPNSVLPGNHDNKRGATDDLFNEYFPPARYAHQEWYGASIAPDDNSANYSTFQVDGAGFLMLSLPYGYGEREIAWAEEVVTAHPRHNVVLSTHEHVTPASPDSRVGRSTSSRWISRAGELYDRVIAPNRNVVVVLSGHFHGLGKIVTEDAGGLAGHTVVELLADYQEFRTDTGERATGFQRLLQVDLGSGTIAVDTFSSTLGAHESHPYDYEQFVPETGDPGVASNSRPWNILEDGLQERYTAADDDFSVQVALQYPKAVVTTGVFVDTLG